MSDRRFYSIFNPYRDRIVSLGLEGIGKELVCFGRGEGEKGSGIEIKGIGALVP